MELCDEFSNVQIIDSTIMDEDSSPIICNCKSKDRKSLYKTKKKKESKLIQKSAVMKLNELKPGLKYVIDAESRPLHKSLFKASVFVDGRMYIGRGTSKKKAKQVAAQAALSSVVKFQKTSKSRLVSVQNTDKRILKAFKTFHKLRMRRQMDLKNRFEVMLLNNIHPGLVYNLIEENPTNPSHRFKMSIEINGNIFEGTGKNKKLAKASAARTVLSTLYNANHTLLLKDLSPEADFFNSPQGFGDKIAKQIMSTFNHVMNDMPDYTKWKVMAGIAMTKDAEMEDVQIVSFSTGAKCVNSEYVNMSGNIIIDCHAEIISRRCLKHFFYTNLELLLQGRYYESIFTERETGGFCLKPHIKFHLYISKAPCGDARIISPPEENVKFEAHDPIYNSEGLLRTKIESGEGTVPVGSDQYIQTWDSILLGNERLLTMSCSDKIASWNVLGLQGALLSHFIEPIYLDSVILGGLFYPNNPRRALFARIEDHVKGLPPLYRINKPQLYETTGPELRHLTMPPNFSVNWIAGQGRPEIISTVTGKIKNDQVSRLAKSSFFQRFINIYDKIPHIDTFIVPNVPVYDAFKESVINYKNAQKALKAAFSAAGLGLWVKKPAEEEYCELE